jgi:signal transduction histidine kinase
MCNKSQSDRIELFKENLNLKELIYETVRVYFPGAEKKMIRIEVEVSDELLIYADKSSMKTVFSNLLNNAIKFTPDKGTIKIDAIQGDHFIEISISDNGIGIPPETLPKLFLIEESVSTPGTDNELGTGLGLLLCKEFIEKHQGKIWVDSELGKGSKFTFTIPNQV